MDRSLPSTIAPVIALSASTVNQRLRTACLPWPQRDTVADDDEDEDSPPMGAWQFVTLHLPLS